MGASLARWRHRQELAAVSPSIPRARLALKRLAHVGGMGNLTPGPSAALKSRSAPGGASRCARVSLPGAERGDSRRVKWPGRTFFSLGGKGAAPAEVGRDAQPAARGFQKLTTENTAFGENGPARTQTR